MLAPCFGGCCLFAEGANEIFSGFVASAEEVAVGVGSVDCQDVGDVDFVAGHLRVEVVGDGDGDMGAEDVAGGA